MRRLTWLLPLLASVALAQSTPYTPLRIAVIHKASVTLPLTCSFGLSPSIIADDTATYYVCTDDTVDTYEAVASAASYDLTVDPLWAAKGDLIAGTGNDAASILTVGSNGKFLKADSGEATGLKWETLAGGGDALTTNALSQFAATTSAELAGVLSDETGSGLAVFATAPNLVNPVTFEDPTSHFKGQFDFSSISSDTTVAVPDGCANALCAETFTSYMPDVGFGPPGLTNADDPILSYLGSGTDATSGWRFYTHRSVANDPWFECIQSEQGIVTCNATISNGYGGTNDSRWKFTSRSSPVVEIVGNFKASKVNLVTITQPAAGSTLTIADGQTLTVNTSTTLPQTTVSGNAGTATALAANGSNCTAGSFAGGVSASGVAEDCTAAFTAAGVPAAETDAAHDNCSEITGCVPGAITAGGAMDALGSTAAAGATGVTIGPAVARTGTAKQVDFVNGGVSQAWFNTAGNLVFKDGGGIFSSYGLDETVYTNMGSLFKKAWTGTMTGQTYAFYIVNKAVPTAASPSSDTYGLQLESTFESSTASASLAAINGASFSASDYGSAASQAIGSVIGGQFNARLAGTDAARSGNTVGQLQAGTFSIALFGTNTTVSSAEGIRFYNPGALGSGSSLAVLYGAHFEQPTRGTANYGLFLEATGTGYKAIAIRDSNVWIGSDAAGQLDLNGTTVKVNGNALSGANTGDQTCATVSGCVVGAITTGDQLVFKTVATTSGTNPVADTTTDTLTITAGGGITVTGDSATDTVTIAATGLTSKCDAWPVSSIFISVSSTNPGTTLGCGTWSAFATGRVLIGLDSGDATMDVAEETGGAKTVASSAQTFTGTASTTVVNHTHTVTVSAGTTDGTWASFDSSTTAGTGHNYTTTNPDSGGAASYTPAGTNAAGAATSVMQPFIAVYMWKRTA